MQINKNGFVEPYGEPIDILGTCYQGELNTTYKNLKSIFGEPSDGDGYKVDAEWVVMTPAGPATIYNYKDGRNYLGVDGLPKTKITDWHVGGNNIHVYAWVALALLTA